MDNQEQIEEMKQIMIKTCLGIRTVQEDYAQSNYAEALYNAGYRKVPFDIRHWFDEIEMKVKVKTDFGTIDFTEKQIHFIEQVICWEEEKIRKETAKEILIDLYFNLQSSVQGKVAKSNDYYNVDGWIKEIAKEYGVEVEE